MSVGSSPLVDDGFWMQLTNDFYIVGRLCDVVWNAEGVNEINHGGRLERGMQTEVGGYLFGRK